MELHNFEKSMHQKFQDFQPEVNDLKIWDGIESKIPKEKKRNVFIWFLWAGVVIASLSTVSYFALFNDTYETTLEQKKTEVLGLNSSADGTLKEEKVNNNETSQNVLSESAIISSNETTEKSEKLVLSQVEDQIVKHSSSRPNTELTVDNPKPNRLALTFNSKPADELDKEQSSNLFNSSIAFAKPKVNMNDQSGIILKAKSDGIIESFKKISLLLINTKALLIPNKNIFVAPAFDFFEKPVAFKPNHSIGIATGYFLMSTNYESADADLLNARSESESALEKINAALTYKYKFAERFSILTGLNFWQANWKSTYTIISSQEVLFSNFQQITRTTETTYIKYGYDRAISIPIIAEFEFLKKENFIGTIGLGYEQNLIGWHKGFELDLDGSIYDIQTDDQGRYKYNSGNYGIAQIGFGYQINDKTLLHINCSGKYGINNFQTSAADIQKSYNFLGLSAGVLKHIN